MSIFIIGLSVLCLFCRFAGPWLPRHVARAVSWRRFLLVLPALPIGVAVTAARSADVSPLTLETKIPLGDVRGRIDHMAIDIGRHRLLVAALGNDSLAVVDLQKRRLERNVDKLHEPQGVGYDPATDMVYVANAGDGSVNLFQGADLSPAGRIDLGSDADNIRVDRAAARVVVGYGDGALAMIDAATRRISARAMLDAHPESFQLAPDGSVVFVNLPNKHGVAVVDSATGKKLSTWSTAGRGANFAMALDQAHQRVLVAFRRPSELAAFSDKDGSIAGSVPTCGDVDDLFVDTRRDRIYLSCGEGFIDVLVLPDGASYRRMARVATAAGARTSLFVPELDRLFVAVPARADRAASIWVFRPSP